MFTERTKCIFCESSDLNTYFHKSYIIPLASYNTITNNEISYSMPFNILSCNKCFTYQIKYLGDINEVYKINHAYSYGYILNQNNTSFTNLIFNNIHDINGIIEIGGGSGTLANHIIEKYNTLYTIVDPYYFGNNDKINLVKDFFEDADISNIKGNTIIMSHVFEHFYEPLKIINKIKDNLNIHYVCINFPDLETYVQKGTLHLLNPEHTYYVQNNFIILLFQKYGFELITKNSYMEHSIYFLFKRNKDINTNIIPINIYTNNQIKSFYNNIFTNVEKITNKINNSNTINYLWPCSIHNIYLFTFGLDYKLFEGILDNSDHKINKFLYHYNIKCLSFKDIIKNTTKPTLIVLNGGCFNKEITEIKNDLIEFFII
jgi:hypothetical protein